jgi:hypothetical protein
MRGAIAGGWGWVAAAWGLSLGLLGVYVAWLTVRLRAEQEASDRPVDRGAEPNA